MILGLSLVLSAVVAGCTGGSDSKDSSDGKPKEPAPEPEVGDDTGAIHGVIVNDEEIAVEGAEVGIPDLSMYAASDALGEFTFSLVPPGAYVVHASGLGYEAAAVTAEVRAGEVTEVPLELVAVAVIGAPYSKLDHKNGMIVCGTGTPVVTQVACGAHDNNQRFLFTYNITPDMSGVLWEVAWTSTQALSKDLVFSLERKGCGLSCPSSSTFASVTGCCTLRVALEAPQLDIGDVKAHTEGAEIQSRTFPAFQSSEGLPTVFTQQAFDVYIEYFYGPLPGDFKDGRTNIPT